MKGRFAMQSFLMSVCLFNKGMAVLEHLQPW